MKRPFVTAEQLRSITQQYPTPFHLYDEKGNVLGDGVSYFQYNFMLSEVDLREGDSLHVCVRHIMKREILPGISDIGLKMIRNR